VSHISGFRIFNAAITGAVCVVELCGIVAKPSQNGA
jgi:hypothetical protein